MKICMICFGPVESKSNGYLIRCYQIVKSLGELGHDIVVMEFPEETPSHSVKSKKYMKFIHLRGNEVISNAISQVLKETLSFDIFHIIRFQIYSLIELIRYRNYLRKCNFVLVEGTLIPFGVFLPKVFRKKVVLDTHCINKLLALRFKDRFLVNFVRKILWDLLERITIRLSDIVIVVSNQEREFVHIEYTIPESKIFVVPNVINISTKSYSKEELDNFRKKWNLENKIIVTFVGNLESIQNKDAAKYIIDDLAPFFWEKRKDVVFLIIGKGHEKFKYAPPNVVFTGFVKELSPFLQISDICIAPLRIGSGVKTKVLEYMSYGKVIVSTLIGVEGIKISKNTNSVLIVEIKNFPKMLLSTIENLGRFKADETQKKIIKKLYSEPVLQQNLNKILRRIIKL